MSEKGDKKTVNAVISMAQDNLLMSRTIRLMGKFILENGLFTTTAFNKTQQYYAVVKYFKSEALNELIQSGYDMSVNTPWGKKIEKSNKSTNSASISDDDVELEYEEDDEEYEDIEDE